MSFKVSGPEKIIIDPTPEFSDISFAGDGRYFLLDGNQGRDGLTMIADPSYNNGKTAVVDGMNYSIFHCDYLIDKNVKMQSADLKVKGAGTKDFAEVEILYRLQADPEAWIMAKRFVRRFYFSTDFENQDTPQLPYTKELQSGLFICRINYYKHESNQNDIELRVNYLLHEVSNA